MSERHFNTWAESVGEPPPCPRCGRVMLAGKCCELERADLEPRPCDLCGKVVMQRHPAFECAWTLRERVRELEVLLADALTRHIEETEGYE